MPKVITDQTENVALCKNVELCKRVLEVLSFDMKSAWVKHQIVDTIIQAVSQ